MLRTVQQFRCPIHSDESLSADGAAVHGEVSEGFVYGGIRTAFGKAHERQPRTKHALRGFTRNLTAHLTHKLWAVLPKEKRIRIPRPDADRTDSRLPACLPVNSLSNRHFGRCGIQIRMSKKQKTTNEWRCGPTSISGSVLLCRVLFCELKPFYRSQWPFSYGSHAPFSDESSSADMFFSQSLPPLFFRRKILRTGCWIPTRQPARIHLQYIILHPPAFVKDFLQKNFPQAFSTEIAENRRNCVAFAPPGFPQFPHPPHPGILCGNFREKS